jgi:peptidyl-prolyl cis-trans isomerase SurA
LKGNHRSGIVSRALALVAVAGAACAILCARDASADTVNRIVAVVNNDVITQGQLDKALASRERGPKGMGELTDRQRALDRLINSRLIEQLMTNAKVDVSEDDLARAIGNILHQNGMTIDQLKSEITSKGMSYEEYKKEVEQQIRRVKFVNQVVGSQVKITDQDLRDYYQRHQDEFRGSVKAHIAQIFLPFAGITTEAEAEKLKETSLSIVTKARRGTSFGELAKNYSKGPKADEGGDLGMVNLKDLPPAIADAVRRMHVGEVSQPIPTDNGLFIVKLIALPEMAAGDFEQLRDRIYGVVYDERVEETMEAYLQKEKQKAFIEIR